MVNKIFSATTTFALALLLTQAAHALLPEIPPSCPGLPRPSPLRAKLDPEFSNSTGSTDALACSNSLETRFPTFGDIPSFPFIGGAYDIVWDSPNCGSCWNVTNPTTGVSILITTINTSGVGINLGPEAFTNLTNGDTSSNVIDRVVATKVSATPCRLA